MSTQPENAPQLDGESPRRDLEEIKQSMIAVQEVIKKAMEGCVFPVIPAVHTLIFFSQY